jgi:hypothetical protein
MRHGAFEKMMVVIFAFSNLVLLFGAYRHRPSDAAALPFVTLFVATVLPVVMIFWAYRIAMPEDRRIQRLVGFLLLSWTMGISSALLLSR